VPAAPDDESALEFVSVGQPIPGCEVRLLDGEGNEVPERVEGRLEFRGPSATRGYYRNPAATQELFNSGATPDSPYPWVDSGDRAYRAGQDYFITGRVKDIIIKAGRNIYPHEAEEAAGTVEGVRRGCVVAFGLTDAEAGTERMVIVAETRGTPDARARSAIAAAVTERVAETVGLPPDVVELVPAGNIPKTSSGKLRRSETRALYLGGKLSGRKLPAWVQVTRLAAVAAGRTTRSWLQRTFDWLYGLYAAVAFAVFLLPTWTAAYFAPTRASASRATQIGTRMFFRMMFIPIRVRGWEHVAAGRPHVFVANHTSFLDVLLFLAIFQFPYRFVSKKEVASWPFIGTFIRRREDFAFERGDRAARLAQAEALERSLREGVSLLIFPEGTFQAAEGVRGFQLGAFKAAQAMNVPVVPVALRGPRQILRDGTRLPRPGAIQVTFCPPLARRRDAPEFAEIIRMRDAARAAIAEHSGEHLL
jgi:1-acyl-sn-glycerol-3-phosphate acyltransferase